MKDRPIIFSAPMVKAILDGRKTQTRRIVKRYNPKPSIRLGRVPVDLFELRSDPKAGPFRMFYQPGMLLWVRETVKAVEGEDAVDRVRYAADETETEIANTLEAAEQWLDLAHYRNPGRGARKRGATVPPIHMPRWVSRLTLEVTAVKVERLQEISEEDAKAEGLRLHKSWGGAEWYAVDGLDLKGPGYRASDRYRELWDHINGPGSWEANPWIVAITFKAHRANIDTIAAVPAALGAGGDAPGHAARSLDSARE